MIIINPGTEGVAGATLANAETIVTQICLDLNIDRASIVRNPDLDDADGGWFGFKHANFEIEVPGDDPEIFLKSKPWVSRRMYVDGNSWLYGYGLGIMQDRLERGEDQ